MIMPCEVKLHRSFSIWFWRIAFKTCLVFLYVSHYMFKPQLVLLQRDLIASLDEVLKAVPRTV